MKDITIIFLTVNKVPQKWAEYQKEVLLKAIGDTPVITIARDKLDWGSLNLVQTQKPSVSNIYRQVLNGCRYAQTRYIGIAEDDTLYSEDHFKARPPQGRFLYNMSRWGVLTWKEEPRFFHRHRESNSAMICERDLAIQCLEERYAKHPGDSGEFAAGELGKEKVQRRLGLPRYKTARWHSWYPIVNMHHTNAIDVLEQEKRKTESKSLIAHEIPMWGRAENLVKKFK